MLVSDETWSLFVAAWVEKYANEPVSVNGLRDIAYDCLLKERWLGKSGFCSSSKRLPNRISRMIKERVKQPVNDRSAINYGYIGGVQYFRLVTCNPKPSITDQSWSDFFTAWFNKFGCVTVSTSDLLDLAPPSFSDVIGDGSELSKKNRLGKLLVRNSARWIGDFRIATMGVGDTSTGSRNVQVYKLVNREAE